ncbi:MAG TPA: hypothetical protein VFR32_00805, partial [Gaiellaceae bacterium]|nr:hypothetical protein [Gaiellaceae bacterium]
MEGGIVSQRFRAFLVIAAVASLVTGAAAQARPIPPSPTVELGSAGGLAPDGRSVDVHVTGSCPSRWTVAEAVVGVVQGAASGQASFPLTCTGAPQSFTVTVSSSGAPFQLADAQGTASVTIERGRTLQARDSETLRMFPSVVVRLADTGLLAGGGASVLVDVTVACAAGPTPQQSYVRLQQGPTMGQGTFLPVCDDTSHPFTVD